MGLCSSFAFLVLSPLIFGQTGVLQLGAPHRSGDTVSVPVRLEGAVSAGVSAMDFRLNYDPAVLQPVGIETGAAASAARKLVQANVATPGEYVVLMFGMNQDTITNGDIANINMRVVDAAAAGESRISIKDTTLSGVDATGLASAGSEATVFLDGPSNPDQPESPKPPEQKPPDSPSGEKPPTKPETDPRLREPLLNIGPSAPAPLPPVAKTRTEIRRSVNPLPGPRRAASEAEADFAARTQGLRDQLAGLPRGGASVDPKALAARAAADDETGSGTAGSEGIPGSDPLGTTHGPATSQPDVAARIADATTADSAPRSVSASSVENSTPKLVVAAIAVLALGAIVYGARRYFLS